MTFLGIIWNYFEAIPSNILETIKNYPEVSGLRNIVILDLNERFEEFVWAIYEYDGIKSEIDFKINYMLQFQSRKVLIFFIDINNTNRETNGEAISIVNKLKCNIREQFSGIYNAHQYASIIHITSNNKETEHMLKTLNSFLCRE